MEKVNVPLSRPQFSEEDVNAIAEVLYSGHLTTSLQCSQLETLFAERLGVAHKGRYGSLCCYGVGPS